MRNIETVLNGMQEVLTIKYKGIIDENEKAADIDHAFNKIRESMFYAAPELIQDSSIKYFKDLTKIVNHYISQNDYHQYHVSI